ncbi:MAG: hypothetical protein IPP06_11365 [Saprospiraceae bacterium]|nr:hypothetical protein [Candidatus Vicinibacter affinis]MBP6172806.1 hypothetical protein [Saprospiraceae bacterium]MBK6572691.1 hypothetical protein [Candidatus Vicinibacter affinis]MBK6824470.1 hypothetical protein [Candidatus Vicinibacter affinis]MBK7303454.1 hypothetical protein [Candidatus Vicinibacter affinis]
MEKFKNILKSYNVPELDLVEPVNKLKYQNIVLIPKTEFPDLAQMDFLAKILASVKLLLNENTDLVELKPDSFFPIKNLPKEKPFDIIAFGITPAQLMLNGCEDLHKTYNLTNIKIIFAHSISIYNGQDLQKKMLWSALKALKSIQ